MFVATNRQKLDEPRVIGRNPRITSYDVLFLKRNFLTRYSAHQNWRDEYLMCGGEFESRYSAYGSLLNIRYRRGGQRRNLMSSAEERKLKYNFIFI